MRRPKHRCTKWSSVRPLTQATFVVELVFLLGFSIEAGSNSSLGKPVNVADIESLINQVFDLNKKQDHQQAIELLLRSVDKEPEDSMLRALLLQTFDLFLEQEVQQGQKDIVKNRANIKAYNRVAGALELLGDNFRAMEMLLNGLQIKPKETDLWMKIARLELKAHREMEALDIFKEVIRLDKKNGDAYNNAAFILTQFSESTDKDLKLAEQYASVAHKLHPKNAEYLDTLAEVQFRRGNQTLALSLIEEAIKLAPQEETLKHKRDRFKGGGHSMVAE
jgi:tetratricopeptide (TPR) repeat protein